MASYIVLEYEEGWQAGHPTNTLASQLWRRNTKYCPSYIMINVQWSEEVTAKDPLWLANCGKAIKAPYQTPWLANCGKGKLLNLYTRS